MEEIKESYAIRAEIQKLENKINVLKRKLNKSFIKDMCEDYIGQYVRIRDADEPEHFHIFMHVKDILHSNINPDCFTFRGQGFSYSDGDYRDDIDGTFSEQLNKIIVKKEIEDGNIRIDILTEDEYKNEVEKMIEFIKRTYENT